MVLIPLQIGAKFLKIGQYLTDIWPVEVLYLKDVQKFSLAEIKIRGKWTPNIHEYLKAM